MKDRWEYYNGDFTADQYNDTLLKYSPWSGHRRFGYDLISYYEPENLVELGSHYGGSMFAFAQSVKDYGLRTKCYAVDLWEASDIYTSHDYERDIFAFFKNVREKEFREADIRMMRTSFDKAADEFDESSIEILHIDGSHEYGDVKHDFKKWMPKMKKDGIILFHDISNQKVLGKIMGSCIFWKELKERYPYTVEMRHSWGLGLLFLSGTKYRDFMDKVNLDHYLQMSIYDENVAKDRIRTDYFRLADANKWIASLRQDKMLADQDNGRLLQELETVKRRYEETDRQKDAYAEELKNIISQYEQTAKAKDVYAGELEETIREYGRTVEAKDAYAGELEETIREYGRTVEAKDAYAGELEETIKEYGRTVEAKDVYAGELEETIREYEQTVQGKDIYAGQLQEAVKAYEQTVAGKDSYIEELQQTIKAYQQEIDKIKEAYEHTIQGKDAYIEELETAGKNRR